MTSENGEIYIKVHACGSSCANKVLEWDDGFHGFSSANKFWEWDDGFHLAIRHIYVYSSENTVDCIQVAYLDPLEVSVLSPKHGSADCSNFFEEIIISPDDRIISVSGCYSTEYEGSFTNEPKALQLLTSLKFVTASGKTYGPYGINSAYDRTASNSFCFKTNSGVRGLHGSANGLNLCSIGIYVQSQAPSVP